MIEPVQVGHRFFLALTADLPDVEAGVVLGIWWPQGNPLDKQPPGPRKGRWVRSGFCVATGLHPSFALTPDPSQAPVEPPYEVEAVLEEDLIRDALARYQGMV
jgi:hypothetical protein